MGREGQKRDAKSAASRGRHKRNKKLKRFLAGKKDKEEIPLSQNSANQEEEDRKRLKDLKRQLKGKKDKKVKEPNEVELDRQKREEKQRKFSELQTKARGGTQDAELEE